MSGSEAGWPAIDPRLLEIIVCPACRSELAAVPDATRAQTLRCVGKECGLTYPVRDGIPVLLVEEAGPGD
ncbi:MAG: Trm112 family protein [Actinomycetes bacterium]